MNQQELKRLISNLSAGEKRHFHLHARRHVVGDGNQYIRLFDQIAKTGDVEGFKKNISAQQYGLVQNYLSKLLEQSLSVYHQSEVEIYEIRNQINICEILHAKGLRESALSKVKKIKKRCEHYEFFNELHQCLNIELKLVNELQVKDLYALSLEIIEDQKHGLEVLNLLNRLQVLYTKAFHLYKSKILRAGDDGEVERLQKDPALKEAEESGVTTVKIRLHAIKGLLFFRKGDVEKALFHQNEVIQCYESNKGWIDVFPDAYFANVGNYMARCHLVNAHERVIERLELLEEQDFSKSVLKGRVFANNIYYGLWVYQKLGQFEKVESIIQEYASLPKSFLKELIPTSKLVIVSEITFFYLLNNDAQEAQVWNNHLLVEFKKAQLQARVNLARIIELLILHDLEHLELLDHKIKAVERVLRKRGRIFPWEKVVLKYLKKRCEGIQKDQIDHLRTLDENLNILRSDTVFQGICRSFDIFRWVQQHITRIS